MIPFSPTQTQANTLPPPQEKDIFPLRDSFFEGIHVKIPYEYAALLAEEYGAKSLTVTEYEGHEFNHTTQVWEATGKPVKKKAPYRKPKTPFRKPPMR